eukprot:CAMPEP_0182429650 /NCGR_PEP_ID=MMETSP1167-20130531/32019_1 /TAXON_ID=2988 /ORGANISM="Mallomonas Sp, Strain CCMP3275" /LENGTH=298 /DNA_ID=CAMNT_0024613649 /DNA_START=156 /DNA_END=1053 /DNA_ORIENTATION=-
MTHTCAAIVILSWCYLSNGFSYHFNKNLRLSARSASKINCDEPITVEALSEDEILKLVNGTDSGIKANDNIVKTVDEWIAAASKTFNETNYPSTALESPFLVGNYEVSFVGTSKTQSSSGNPAGGGYRGVLGRFIYKNEGLYQHIIRENKNGSNSPVGVINYITGRVLGLFTLSVILKGVVEAVSREEREGLTARYGTPLTAGTVRAKFGSPLLGLGWRGRGTGKKTRLLGALSVGPSSEVVLDTPSVSPTLRTGRGSRGSTFLFARTSSPAAEGYRAVLETAPVEERELDEDCSGWE